MKRPSVPVIAAVPAAFRNSRRARTLREALKISAAASTVLALSGCYYYYPYGYGPYYTGPVPMATTQQETAIAQNAPNPAPAAMPDAQYPGPLYSTAPVAIAVPAWPAYPAYGAYPAYYPYPAYGWGGWGWGAPAVSFGFGYWGGGGGHWHH
jgi:hypothetical protein